MSHGSQYYNTTLVSQSFSESISFSLSHLRPTHFVFPLFHFNSLLPSSHSLYIPSLPSYLRPTQFVSPLPLNTLLRLSHSHSLSKYTPTFVFFTSSSFSSSNHPPTCVPLSNTSFFSIHHISTSVSVNFSFFSSFKFTSTFVPITCSPVASFYYIPSKAQSSVQIYLLPMFLFLSSIASSSIVPSPFHQDYSLNLHTLLSSPSLYIFLLVCTSFRISTSPYSLLLFSIPL